MNRFKAWLRTWYHAFVCNDNVQRSYPKQGHDESTRGSAWRHGRWFFHYGRRPMKKYAESHAQEYAHPYEFSLEWCWFKRNSANLGIKFDTGDGNKAVLCLGIPWVLSLYVGHSMPARFMRWLLPWYTYEHGGEVSGWPLSREIEVSVHNATVWVQLWVDPMNGDYGDFGNTKLPRWRNFNFTINPLDLLGKVRCETEIVEPERAVMIPMPEGEYSGLLQLDRRTWTRKLWPWWPLKLTRITRHIETPDGIPFSGKGENSWDCGEDGIYATGFDVTTANTDEKACALYAAYALEMRVRRGDPRIWSESPGDRAARLAIMRADQKHAVASDSQEKQEKPL